MVAWFITAITTVGLFAYIAFVGVSSVSQASAIGSRTEAVQRLDRVAETLMRRAANVGTDGIAYLPAGTPPQTAGGLYGVPADLAALTPPSGVPVAYCPLGGDTLTGTETQTIKTGTVSYSAGISYLNDRPYVVTGRPETFANVSDTNLMGFVIATMSKDTEQVGCADVTYANGAYTAPGAIVRPLMRTMSEIASRQEADTDVVYYVSAEQDVAGNGLDQSQPTTIGAALAYYREKAPVSMTIVLTGGTYDLNQGDLVYGTAGRNWAARTNRSSLTLRSASTAAPATINAPGGVSTGYDLTLQNVAFNKGAVTAATRGETIRMTGSSAGQMTLTNGSSLIVSGQNTLASSVAGATVIGTANASNVIVEQGGTLNVTYASNTLLAFSLAGGSSLTMNASNMIIASSNGGTVTTGLQVAAGSTAALNQGVITVNSPYQSAVAVVGKMTMQALSKVQTGVTGTVGVNLLAGGSLFMDSADGAGGSPSTIGGSGTTTSPTYAVADSGGIYVGGSGTAVAKSQCWYNNTGSANASLFAYVANTGMSTITADVDPAPQLTSARPTSSEIANYQTVLQTNLRKSYMRRMNMSTMRCTIR